MVGWQTINAISFLFAIAIDAQQRVHTSLTFYKITNLEHMM